MSEIKMTRAGLRRFLQSQPPDTRHGVEARTCPLAAFLRARGAADPFVERDWYALHGVPDSPVAHLTYLGPRTRLASWAQEFNARIEAEPMEITSARALALLEAIAVPETAEAVD